MKQTRVCPSYLLFSSGPRGTTSESLQSLKAAVRSRRLCCLSGEMECPACPLHVSSLSCEEMGRLMEGPGHPCKPELGREGSYKTKDILSPWQGRDLSVQAGTGKEGSGGLNTNLWV